MKNKNEKSFTPREHRVLTVACYGHFVSHFNMLVFPALVLPLAGRMEMEMAAVLGLSFWMYLLFGVTALPWGLAADRWGAMPFFLLFFLGSAVSGLAAAACLDSPEWFSFSLAVLGLFSGIYHPVGLGMISKEIERVGLGMGYNGMFGNLGLFAAPLVAGLVNWLWGPRSAFLLIAFFNLAGAGLVFLVPAVPSREERRADPETESSYLGAFLILLVVMMLGGICYRGATVSLPSYFEFKTSVLLGRLSALTMTSFSPNVVATTVTSLIYLVGMLGQYMGGRAAERFDPRYSYLLFFTVTVPAAFLMSVTSDLPLAGMALIYFFFLLGMQPSENTLVTRFTPNRFRHSAFGTKFVLTFGVGALAVKMVQALEVSYGMESVFTALGGISLVIVGGIVTLILTTRRV